ncbi:DUF2179 domain-containing protein [bacterium]|nr:DUF2179 domain-containing protein [bacterium]MBU1065443.1 DUF2179 domain-containing protein [bacterium]MBU1633806.1 DUF2179 domain-containing protein [bacterium]MBU1872893.1 DUF2179 domain-containing protein [bacterium]
MHFLTENPWVTSWVIIPLLIFLARVTDVSIGTFRIILVSKGQKVIAAILGFIEISIWLLAISQVFQHLSNIACFFAYGLGFALGNYVGIAIEEKIALGQQAIRIITSNTMEILPMALRDAGYGATVIKANGGKGEVNLIFSVMPRNQVKDAIALAQEIDPDIFISLQDIRSVNAGFMPLRTPSFGWRRITKKK